MNGSPTCTSSPVFNGVTSVINPQGNTCEILLSWDSATSTCPTAPNVSYHIYTQSERFSTCKNKEPGLRGSHDKDFSIIANIDYFNPGG
mgnify:CR=1